MVTDDSFFSRSVVVEAGRPALECFETKREGVLSWKEITSLIDHRFISGEVISCLLIGHSKISIA
jgi:hypothetical protein